jgi:uncharacterized membrane protein
VIRLVDGRIVSDAAAIPRGVGSGERVSLFETIRFALRGVTANKLRSGLTVLGILIGVAAVILLVAVGNGSAMAIQKAIEQLGTNTLTISSGRGAAGDRLHAEHGVHPRPGDAHWTTRTRRRT